MYKLPAAAAALLFLLVTLTTTTTNAHNITTILAAHPDFSTFNHYLTTTHLADEINRRRTITVCAVDNAGMNELLSKHLSLPSLKNVLSLHIFADYFGAKKLHQISKGTTSTSTLFQATGEAAGTAGYVKITDGKGGKVSFSVADYEGEFGDPIATFVKSIHEINYDLAVLQISHILTSEDAEAPVGAPVDMNVTNLMQRQGCKAFADLLKSSGAEEAFTQNAAGGITVFCPTDGALNAFLPRYKNLTNDGKTTLLLFHGIPFYNSMGMLKSKNGVLNTLATEGRNKFNLTVKVDGDDVTVSAVNTATITGTLIDQDPLAVYKVDKVLLPRQLFKSEPGAPAPKSSKGKKGEDDDAPGPSGDDDSVPADQTASDNGSMRVNGGGWAVSVVLSFVLGCLMSGIQLI